MTEHTQQEMREWLEEARAMGKNAARAAASWVADGNSDTEVLRRLLEALEDGDPAAWDSLPHEPNLSGEWADDPTPSTLASEITMFEAYDLPPDLIDEIAADLGIRVEVRGRRELRGGPDRGATEYSFGLRPIYGSDEYRLIRDGMGGTRRVNAVCWHGHFYFMDEVFTEDPDARIISAVATYNGREGFLEGAPPTGDKNIGSQFYPLSYRDACDCGY